MIGGGPKPPKEDPAVKVLRARQIRELADLDEEENRRLKSAFRTSRGIRAFRRSGGSDASVGGDRFGGGGIPGSGGGGGPNAGTGGGRPRRRAGTIALP